MVQACRNGQTHLRGRILICGIIVCYGAALAPATASAFGQYDVLRELGAQQEHPQGRQRPLYYGRQRLPGSVRGPYDGGDDDDDGDVARLASYMDEFMGLDRPDVPQGFGGGPLLRDLAAQVEEAEEEAEDTKIRFPRLTGEQKNFAVHPGYPTYYNHELRQIEDEIEKRQGALRRGRPAANRKPKVPDSGSDDEGNEVAEHPAAANDQDDQLGMMFGRVRQAPPAPPEGVADVPAAAVSVEEIEDAILKKADADGGVVITGLGDRDGSGGGFQMGDVSFTVIVAVCSAIAAFTIVLAGVIYHRLQKNTKAAEDVEYPAYGVTAAGGGGGGAGGSAGRGGHDGGSAGSPTSAGTGGGGSANGASAAAAGDRKLAQNAQMYHYQHQKQQMIAFDSHQNGGNRNRLGSDDNDSDEGEEGDYTVYECPGLAPTGEMEVRNPMFSDDQTTPKANGGK